MNLSSENVNDVFMNCLFKEGENTEIHKIGSGVRMNVGFHPERLSKSESNIIEMLNELPDSFKKTGGGGMSFLNMCVDNKGVQWGDHSSIDQLICLGSAIGKVVFPMPKEMWDILPGGVPYVTVEL